MTTATQLPPAPPLQLLKPIPLGERFFPEGLPCGFYPDAAGVLHPNVTSILAERWPFDLKNWQRYEPEGFDCEAAASQAAATGTAVHAVLEGYLLGQDISDYDQQLLPWVAPLVGAVSQAKAVLGVEVPIAHQLQGLRYAGSCDALLLGVDGAVVVVDHKTRRDVSYKKDTPNRPNLKYLDKQKTQVACYARTISAIYADQLPAPVTRASLLFAVPGEEQPTVVSIAGDELVHYARLWNECLSEFYDKHGAAIAAYESSTTPKQ